MHANSCQVFRIRVAITQTPYVVQRNSSTAHIERFRMISAGSKMAEFLSRSLCWTFLKNCYGVIEIAC